MTKVYVLEMHVPTPDGDLTETLGVFSSKEQALAGIKKALADFVLNYANEEEYEDYEVSDDGLEHTAECIHEFAPGAAHLIAREYEVDA